MEGIEEALENAEYAEAMREGALQPTKDWDWLDAEDLVAQIQRLDPIDLDLETLCARNLGLYLFIKFVRNEGSMIMGDFIVALADFRSKKQRPTELLQHATSIFKTYLVDGSTGDFEASTEFIDLSRILHTSDTPDTAPSSVTAGGNNALQLSGPTLLEIRALLLGAKEKTGGDAIKPSIFDEVDRAVFAILRERHYEQFMKSADWFRYFQFLILSQKELNKDRDFITLRVLGRGGFGLVYASKKATTGKLYAIKQMAKQRIKLKKSFAMVKAERDILSQVDSPYIVQLMYAFQCPTDVYLVMDMMVGGDLSYHLNSRGCFPPEEARFYSARLISALLCLHSLNIVHRDLKPENILMDTRGYTKLTDFGLADYVPSTGLTVPCGTRGYWAPEMISRPFKPYFYSVDWFSLGVCIYEFLTGENPFFYIAGDDDAAVDRTIISGEPDYSLIKDDSADLLRLLLCKDPAQRLGSGPEGAQAIQQHDWFAGIDWESLSTMIPPWFPESEINMKDQGEIGDFKDANESKKVLLTEEDQLMYAEWSYVSQPAFQKEVLEFLLYEEIRGPIRPVDNSECCILS